MSEASETLFRRQSAFQRIELTREGDGSLSLTLDDVWQFSSRDEARFHEVLVEPAMVLAPRVERVLVLGGGDGLAARNALRYPGVRELVLCELDPAVIEMTRSVDAMRTLSDASLEDPRVQVVIGDAREFVAEAHAPFDVVICDFPAATEPALASLHDRAFFEQAASVMAADAVLTAQVSLEPPGFWEVLEDLGAALGHVQARLVRLEDDLWADAIVGTGTSATAEPRRPFPDGLEFMTTERLESLRITNRGGDRFETVEYGREPSFDEPW